MSDNDTTENIEKELDRNSEDFSKNIGQDQDADSLENNLENLESNQEISDGDVDSIDGQSIGHEQEMDTLREDLSREKDKFLRLFAEFENFKRRTSKERMDMFKTAGQEIMTSLLPVLDDFDRALRELAKSDNKEMFKGVELIRVKLRETLKSKGLEEMDAKAGDTFDAELHEAITQIPAPDKKMKGKIVDVVERGFKLGDRIIRHPKVVVGK